MALSDIAKLIYKKGLESVLPLSLISKNLKTNQGNLVVAGRKYKLNNNVFIVGFGKAVLGMARSVEDLLKNHLQKGILSVPVNISSSLMKSTFKDARDMLLCDGSKIIAREGARDNLPDEAALETSQEIETLVQSLKEEDILIVLISGGGSALLPAPVKEISFEDKLETIKWLSKGGATIQELNTLRKQLSRLKGGKLATMTRSKSIISLILSDIVGDPLDLIASGPTFPDCSTPADCLSILENYKIMDRIPDRVREYLLHRNIEMISSFKSSLSNVQNFIIGSNTIAVQNCKMTAEKQGFPVVILSEKLTGNVRNVSESFAELLFWLLQDTKPKCKSCFDYELLENAYKSFRANDKICLLSAGETTVHVRGSGKGGRNQELALQTALSFENLCKESNLTPEFEDLSFCFLSAGTDGQDGPTSAAGAIFMQELFAKAKQQKLSIQEYLDNNGSHDFFSKLDNGSDLLVTGLTGTNVMDIQILLVKRSPLS